VFFLGEVEGKSEVVVGFQEEREKKDSHATSVVLETGGPKAKCVERRYVIKKERERRDLGKIAIDLFIKPLGDRVGVGVGGWERKYWFPKKKETL